MTLADAAATLAAHGYHVHPLRPREKVPATTRGFKDASCDPRQVAQWWAEMPAANIGVACGASGVAVLDIDTKAGADPREILSQYDRADAPVVGTGIGPERSTRYPRSLAGRRGVQVYFKGSMSSAGRLTIAGCEIKAVGGYVVAPPSVHPCGVEYVGELPAVEELPAVPDWLRELVYKPPPPARTIGSAEPSRVLDGLTRTVATAETGNRNRALFWAVCRAVEHIVAGELDGHAIDTIRAAAIDAGLGEAEIEATIRSGLATQGRAAA